MEWDASIRAWYCWTCGRLYRLAEVVQRIGFAAGDRWMVGAEDGDDA